MAKKKKGKESPTTYEVIESGKSVSLYGKYIGKKKEKVSLYLSLYNNGKRSYDFLSLHYKRDPRSAEDRIFKRECIEQAIAIREAREQEFKSRIHGIVNPSLRKMDFRDYCDEFVETYPNKDIRIVRYCVRSFKEYCESKIKDPVLVPSMVTENLLRGFKVFLDDKYNGETPYNYFAKMKRICKEATKQKLFMENPSLDIVNKRKEGLKKDILFFDEIQKLADTPCRNEEVRRAFFTSLYTGLRFVDIFKKLTWSCISKDIIILKAQAKTERTVEIPIGKTVKILLGTPREAQEPVFDLPSHTTCLIVLKEWTKAAGIKKNITWHSARHSFGVNLLKESNTDIKTLSSLLGHASTKHTQKYTRVVSELKVKAIDNLPEIQL